MSSCYINARQPLIGDVDFIVVIFQDPLNETLAANVVFYV
jgi:hypothetical protein